MSDLPADDKSDEVKNADAVSDKAAPKNTPHAPSAIPVNTQPLLAPVEQHSPQGNQGDVAKKENYAFEIAGFVCAIVGLVVLIWQTILLKDSNKSTKASVDLMRQQLILDKRAWVVAEATEGSLSYETNGCFFSLNIKNIGETPALVTSCYIGAATSTNFIDEEIIPETKVYFLQPNSYPTTVLKTELIPFEMVKASSSIPLYIYGRIYYEDIFEEKHWTKFCWVVDGGGVGYSKPHFHNGTDRVKMDNKHKTITAQMLGL